MTFYYFYQLTWTCDVVSTQVFFNAQIDNAYKKYVDEKPNSSHLDADVSQTPPTQTGGQTCPAPWHGLHGDAPPSHRPLMENDSDRSVLLSNQRLD